MQSLSVTQVVGAFNPAKEYMNNQNSLDFGKAVHIACEYDDEHCLNEPELDINLKPYLASWRMFKNDFKPEFLEIEKRHSDFYTGCPDRLAIVQGKKILISIKTGGFQEGACGLQEAGYANLLNWEIEGAWVIVLNENKYNIATTFKVKELKKYYSVFLSMYNTLTFINNGFKF